jgi:hypothetical protein
MQHHSRGWGAVGGSLLLAAASHGWILLLGVAAILALTYLAAYLLIRELKGRKILRTTIITPILTIKAGLDDHDDATDACPDRKGSVAEHREPKRYHGGAMTHATRKKHSAERRNRRQCPARPSKHAAGTGSLIALPANPQKPDYPALNADILWLFDSYLVIRI